MEHRLAALVTAIDDDNETARAIKTAFGQPPVQATEVLPFSSSRKWVGLRLMVTLTLWAHRNLFFTTVPGELQSRIKTLAQQGYRVLVLAEVAALTTPKPTRPMTLGLILITDELRPHAKTTFGFC